MIIAALVQVVNEDGAFATIDFALSLREVGQSTKAAASISLFDTHAWVRLEFTQGVTCGFVRMLVDQN